MIRNQQFIAEFKSNNFALYIYQDKPIIKEFALIPWLQKMRTR